MRGVLSIAIMFILSSHQTDNELNVRGNQTLGENIADNGGLKAAFHAYKSWGEKQRDEQVSTAIHAAGHRPKYFHRPPDPTTHDQLFFLSVSQVWCSSATPEGTYLPLKFKCFFRLYQRY